MNKDEAAVERLLDYWRFHKGLDANMTDLARYAGVSRDTLYRWLNHKAIPKKDKIRSIDEWLNKRKGNTQSKMV